ncbi:polysaccharide deacetylase family protein [Glaciimonas immobilis]|uniref:Peptidoglycan/xylan/chitin deacetylase (PgdA/CDA1 family) n=1 Tax=Glaciimonas immobilis TaxID=728004 RepID=A0A840RXU8_9BURK|nr:polysaccharide deacetylase family protein [Glaciimonas immobilis]KAF3996434.1 polysaccharide deacetylase family protein [Glaciimonas immobilis]MBB5201229.1 peptidoglycan/xylan/chitin deacetylase (PgdA/CDA1 family) [Glaciimonas immobilis]
MTSRTTKRRWSPTALAAVLVALSCAGVVLQAQAQPKTVTPASCKGTLYLTFDTGSQSQAEFIAETLRRHHIKATFFMANEKTVNEDYSLDPSWAPFWKSLVADGHAFGSHTFDHVYAKRDLPDGKIEMKPQFGANAGKLLAWTPQQYCDEINRVEQRFHSLTGTHLDPFWRAPGGHLTPRTLAAGQACGYEHVAWADAGFSGDELPSEKWPNKMLLERELQNVKAGDILIAHLGIWSRKDPWAPAVLEPLISGLEKKGFCFATLRDHPDYKAAAEKARGRSPGPYDNPTASGRKHAVS